MNTHLSEHKHGLKPINITNSRQPLTIEIISFVFCFYMGCALCVILKAWCTLCQSAHYT